MRRVMCDDEDRQQEEQIWPWINDPSDECENMPTGYWADYIFDSPEEDE